MIPQRVGRVSATTVGVVGVVYLAVLAVGMAKYGLSEPIGDPILAVMEVLTLVSAPPLVLLIVAMHEVAGRERRMWGVVALCFISMFAVTTSAVHAVELTAGRQLGWQGLVWPSTTYALELLAWDWFLGLALMAAAETLSPQPSDARLRRGLRLTGMLCLIGSVGPVVGNMRLQLIGVLGYGLALPVLAFALARWFRRTGDVERGVSA